MGALAAALHLSFTCLSMAALTSAPQPRFGLRSGSACLLAHPFATIRHKRTSCSGRTSTFLSVNPQEYVALRLQKLTQIAQLLLVLPLHQLDQSILIWLLASSGTASLTHAALRPMFRRRAAIERSATRGSHRRAATRTQHNSRLAAEQLLRAEPADSAAQRLDDALNATILHRHNEDLGAHRCDRRCVFCARGVKGLGSEVDIQID